MDEEGRPLLGEGPEGTTDEAWLDEDGWIIEEELKVPLDEEPDFLEEDW